jgi:hypothetical protein
MRKVLILIGVTISLLIQTSCTDTKPEHTEIYKPDSLDLSLPIEDGTDKTQNAPSAVKEGEDEKIRLVLTNEDDKLLSWVDSIPLGITYSQIKSLMPNIGMQRPKGNNEQLAKQGSTEARLKINLLHRKGNIDFNFKNDTLYSFFYTLTEADFEKADDIYYGLQNFYSKKIGPCVEDKVEEYNRYSKSCLWESTKYNATMTYNLNSNIISWGIQKK